MKVEKITHLEGNECCIHILINLRSSSILAAFEERNIKMRNIIKIKVRNITYLEENECCIHILMILSYSSILAVFEQQNIINDQDNKNKNKKDHIP